MVWWWLGWYDLAAGYKSFIRKLLIIHVKTMWENKIEQSGECLNKATMKMGGGARKHKINDCPKYS